MKITSIGAKTRASFLSTAPAEASAARGGDAGALSAAEAVDEEELLELEVEIAVAVDMIMLFCVIETLLFFIFVRNALLLLSANAW